jgi:DNA-binding transcriptional MerR regulator
MSEKLLSIGTVARLTDLTTHVIRAWEKRYHLNLAKRDAKGRRLYSLSDVEHLRLLNHAVNKGIKISDAAALTFHQLTQLLTTKADQPEADNSWIVFGAQLVHQLFNLKPNNHYRVANSLAEIQQSLVNNKGVKNIWLYLSDINDSIEHFIYDLLIQYGDTVQLTIFLQSSQTQARHRLASSSVKLITQPLCHELLVQTIEQLKQEPSLQQKTQPSTIDMKRLASLSTDLYCDCPRHLAELYQQTRSFIDYSESCEKLSPKDRAMHRFIHQQLIQVEALLVSIGEQMDRLGELNT